MAEKITHTMVDNDIKMVFDSIKSHDCVIPPSMQILALFS